MREDRWWRGFDDVIVEAVPPGSRVLDVGCGDGGLVERLAERGLDAWGVDPRAPAGPRFHRARVEELGAIGPFDAVSSVMALHHADLDAATEAIARLVAPHGPLLVFELAWEDYDERAAAWLVRHDAAGPNSSPAAWHAEHGDLHPSTAVRAAIDRRFDVRAERDLAYLARIAGRADLEPEEQRLMGAGALPAIGRLWECRGRPGRSDGRRR